MIYIKNLVLYYNLEEWDRVGVEGRFKRKGHMYAYGWFLLMYGRTQYNIVKKLSSSQKILKVLKKELVGNNHNFSSAEGKYEFLSVK